MSYLMLWLTYVFAIAIACFGFWRLFHGIWNNWWSFVFFGLLVLPFLVPFAVESESYAGAWMAPAMVVVAFESIAGNDHLVESALRPIILVECAALFLVMLLFIVRKRRASGQN